MLPKQSERDTAIKLRKQGKSYNEILKEVHVAKSTLSLWLREVGLSKAQKQTLTAKKRAAQIRGGARRRAMRLEQTDEINALCRKDISSLSDRELFLMGIALYWAEGTKANGNRPGAMIDFANSDPAMVRLFVDWLLKFGNVKKQDIIPRLHAHENHREREKELKTTWSMILKLPVEQFSKTNFKKHNPKTKRYKTGQDYIGLVSVRVKKSTELNRRILGWIYAIIATQK